MRLGILLALTLGLCAGAGAANRVAEQGNCAIACDQKLARCEQKLGRQGRCPMKHMACNDQCTKPEKADRRSPAEREQARCEQQCDLNRTMCERANPNDEKLCADSRNGCVARCD